MSIELEKLQFELQLKIVVGVIFRQNLDFSPFLVSEYLDFLLNISKPLFRRKNSGNVTKFALSQHHLMQITPNLNFK